MTRKEFLMQFVSDIYKLPLKNLKYTTGSHWGHVTIDNPQVGSIAIFCDRSKKTGLNRIKFKWNPSICVKDGSFEAKELELKSNIYLQRRGFDAITELSKPLKSSVCKVSETWGHYPTVISLGKWPWTQTKISFSDKQVIEDAFALNKRFRVVADLKEKWSQITDDLYSF